MQRVPVLFKTLRKYQAVSASSGPPPVAATNPYLPSSEGRWAMPQQRVEKSLQVTVHHPGGTGADVDNAIDLVQVLLDRLVLVLENTDSIPVEVAEVTPHTGTDMAVLQLDHFHAVPGIAADGFYDRRIGRVFRQAIAGEDQDGLVAGFRRRGVVHGKPWTPVGGREIHALHHGIVSGGHIPIGQRAVEMPSQDASTVLRHLFVVHVAKEGIAHGRHIPSVAKAQLLADKAHPVEDEIVVGTG
jgi:hypothetical protein